MKDYFIEEEEVKTKKNRRHYVKNTQYEEISNIQQSINTLKDAKIDNKRIYGYLKKSNNNKVICKYDKLNGLFITISEDKVTHEILSWGEYQGRRAYEYYDEI